jgi:hypothetical protein
MFPVLWCLSRMPPVMALLHLSITIRHIRCRASLHSLLLFEGSRKIKAEGINLIQLTSSIPLTTPHHHDQDIVIMQSKQSRRDITRGLAPSASRRAEWTEASAGLVFGSRRAAPPKFQAPSHDSAPPANTTPQPPPCLAASSCTHAPTTQLPH